MSPEDAVLQSASKDELVTLFHRFPSGSKIYNKAHSKFLELV